MAVNISQFEMLTGKFLETRSEDVLDPSHFGIWAEKFLIIHRLSNVIETLRVFLGSRFCRNFCLFRHATFSAKINWIQVKNKNRICSKPVAKSNAMDLCYV